MTMDYDPDTYNSKAVDTIGPGNYLLNLIDAHLTKHSIDRNNITIVDFGCGPGNTAKMIAERFPEAHIVGLDIDASMIQYANDNNQNSKCEFFVQNLSAPFSEWCEEFRNKYSNQVDVAFSNYTMHWIRDTCQFSANLYQLLKPKTGMLAASVLYNGDIATVAQTEEEKSLVGKIAYPTEREYITNWLFSFKNNGLKRICFHYTEPVSLYDETYYKESFVKIPQKWFLGYTEEPTPEIAELIRQLLFRIRICGTVPSKTSPGKNEIEIKQNMWITSLYKD